MQKNESKVSKEMMKKLVLKLVLCVFKEKLKAELFKKSYPKMLTINF